MKDKTSSSDKGAKLKKLRQTNFKWQLGRKLGGSIIYDTCFSCSLHYFVHFFFVGQGSFGKVYECLNRTTGEINAVKQVHTVHTCDRERLMQSNRYICVIGLEYVSKQLLSEQAS